VATLQIRREEYGISTPLNGRYTGPHLIQDEMRTASMESEGAEPPRDLSLIQKLNSTQVTFAL
jgi:hypothetical protein